MCLFSCTYVTFPCYLRALYRILDPRYFVSSGKGAQTMQNSILDRPVVWLLLRRTDIDWINPTLVSVHLSEKAAERAERKLLRGKKRKPHFLIEEVEGRALLEAGL